MHILYLIYWVISNNTDNYTFTKNIKAYKGVYYEKFYLYFPELPHQLLVILQRAKNNGLNVLGIVDQPYDELSYELKNSLNEYYRVDNLENYESVYRAVAFFIHKYGRVDWLESNNEYWLEQNAKLRSDFNIQSGFQTKDIPRIKFKSKMKSYYEKAGISTARYTIAADLKEWKAFTKKVGYPIIAKPDNGVGASDTHRISSDKELTAFFQSKAPDVTYILEEYIDAAVNSYDAIIDSHGEPIFETGNVTPNSIMDIVNNADNSIYYIVKDLSEDTRKTGRAAAKSFGVKSRFIHFEFFRLLSDHPGMGKRERS